MYHLKKFDNKEGYTEFMESCDYIMPNVSKTPDKVYYNREIRVGDYLFSDGMIAPCLIEGKTPIAVCVVDADVIGDGYYRFMSVLSSGRIGAFDPDIIEGDTSTYYSNLELKHGWHCPTINAATGEYDRPKLYGWYTAPGMKEIYPDKFNVEINGNWYVGLGDTDLEHRGYAPPAFNADGSKNELYWAEMAGQYYNPLIDFDGEGNTKSWLKSGRNLLHVKFCAEYAPGFKDGEWYMPADGEMGLMCWNRAKLIDKFTAAKEFLGNPSNGITLKSPNPSFYTSTEQSDYNERCFSLEGSAQTSTLRNKNSTPYSSVPFLKIKREK